VEEVAEMSLVVQKLQKNPFDMEAGGNEAALSTYKNKDNVYYIPSTHLQEALVKAGSEINVKGKGKKTYKDYMKSYVFVDPDEIPIQPQKYELDRAFVKVQRNGIYRHRPRFENWGAEFSLMITDPTLPLDEIKKILEIAGTRKGIGDYRPRFGLFEVTAFDVV
jgi:hypothetical protein